MTVVGIEFRPVEHRLNRRGKAYEVFADGKKLGGVQHCWPTFERAPEGATYVTKRWTSKRPYWEHWIGDDRWRASGESETRKRAVERLIRIVQIRAEDEE